MPGNFLYHCVMVRYRLTGTGEFNARLFSLDDEFEYELPAKTLALTNNRYVDSTCNFTEQRINLEFSVDEINETFLLRQVQFYIKPVSTGYPQ